MIDKGHAKVFLIDIGKHYEVQLPHTSEVPICLNAAFMSNNMII
jgi:hypothetical protein